MRQVRDATMWRGKRRALSSLGCLLPHLRALKPLASSEAGLLGGVPGWEGCRQEIFGGSIVTMIISIFDFIFVLVVLCLALIITIIIQNTGAAAFEPRRQYRVPAERRCRMCHPPLPCFLEQLHLPSQCGYTGEHGMG